MELGQEKEELFYSFPLDLSDEEAKRLRDFGLKVIAEDADALINYAVNYMLKKQVEKLEKTNKDLVNKIKEKNNGESKS